MKKITFFILISVLFFGCKTNEGNTTEETTAPPTALQQDIYKTPYLNYTDFEMFREYDKITDTLIYAEYFHPQFSLLQIQKENETVVLFNKFSIDENEELLNDVSNYEREILDTIKIFNLKPNEVLITGCCEMEEKYGEEMIAIIEKTDGLIAEKIGRAWRANIETGRIEEVYDLEKVKCFNKNHKVELPKSEF